MKTLWLANLNSIKTFVESHKEINMTCLFTVFGPGQPVFKNDDSNMIDLWQKENNVFIVVLDFLTAFFIVNSLQYFIILS